MSASEKFFVDADGNFLGCFWGGEPENGIEVPIAPADARQKWNFDALMYGDVPVSVEVYEDAIQAHVDAAARSKLFRDGVTLASYVASTNPVWAAEAQAFVAWRDQVWAHAYQELARVMGGEREQPTVAEIIAELPTISWP